MYAVGGFDNEGGALSSAEKYDPLTNEWVQIPPVPSVRSYCGTAAARDPHGATEHINPFPHSFCFWLRQNLSPARERSIIANVDTSVEKYRFSVLCEYTMCDPCAAQDCACWITASMWWGASIQRTVKWSPKWYHQYCTVSFGQQHESCYNPDIL